MRNANMPDWLVHPVSLKAEARLSDDGTTLQLSNELVSRYIRLAPNAATVELVNHSTGESLLRGAKPEAELSLDGVTWSVGGLDGQPDYGYLDSAWLDEMTANPNAFQYRGHEIGPLRERFPWSCRRAGAEGAAWPPPGIEVVLSFDAPDAAPELAGMTVCVHYEIYEGLPLLSKRISLHNGTGQAVTLDNITTECLAVVEPESAVEYRLEWRKPLMHVESDYCFHGMDSVSANQTVAWTVDPQYDTQVNYARLTPALLTSSYPKGVGIVLKSDEIFESYRTYELFFDDDDRERQGLSIRRMYRTLAPWILENPVYFHLVGSDSQSIRNAVDQCVAAGFDMLLISFGLPVHTDGTKGESQVDEEAFSLQNGNSNFLKRMREDIAYAHGRGIEVGSYTLTSSADAGPEWNVIHPETGRPDGAIFGQAPCLASEWADTYYEHIHRFIEETGLDCVEDDGSYPGDQCASTAHAYHEGVSDSQYRQWERITGFYQKCRAQGVYLNVPDSYLLQGTNKMPMEYRETNFSLPRPIQILHARQNIFDGSWKKAPSMGWMFVPLTAYHADSPEAVFEPLEEHLDELEWHLAQNFGSGVMAAYRGRRLYDTEKTCAVISKWVVFYRAHRAILDSDIIHVRRPDGRRIDCMMHANSTLLERGLVMLYNPTACNLQETLVLPLYYTGLTETARIRERNAAAVDYRLNRDYSVEVPVKVPACSITWLLIEAGDESDCGLL